MKIYICGHQVLQNSKENFENSETIIKNKGFSAVNPIKVIPEGLNGKENIIRNGTILMECDGIYVQKDYIDDCVSRIMYKIAREFKLQIIFEP